MSVSPSVGEASSHADRFRRFATRMSLLSGHPNAFALAVLYVVVWAVTGPVFGFSDTWQLVINTSSSIVTLLMVFLIQTSQNRDTAAIHLKLDELVRATAHATDRVVAAEELTEAELGELKQEVRAAKAEQEERPT
ncbi:low affinity Fe/Cu permease [Rhodoblastus acidophilus]|uniref:low affinity iron permease family protein n=1 Tax=Rhodoblastus acidophilus TaxID=1074 RepID=UPI00160E3ECD|nr:low affinity iron permease family protein [Rhodoblastus acidophilus]MCW2285332.1 low affinity Fe/Cu permease [Rhodoblastus acidophilus]MCW2334288.1 low affinity Fe/Cu permease [Rhodoblastus acidophilus]